MPRRRQPATLLFSAIAATAAVATLALPASSDGPVRSSAPTAPLIVERPLGGVTGGDETIRDVHQDTPFSMVALTADDLRGTSARVRARRADGNWGPWYRADGVDGGDEGTGGQVRGTEAIYVGKTTDVQISVRRPLGAAPTRDGRPAPKPDLGYRPANVEAPLPNTLNAVLITPPRAPVDAAAIPPEAATTPGTGPSVIPRAQWGADEAMRCGNVVYDRSVRAAVVHHTAGSNDYAPQDSAGIVRSIYAYHTRTLGWCDIAYNALVDKYGQVFEGRAGGMDRPVEGSHAGGFNQDTWGVAMMGDFDVVPPTPVQLRTTGRLLGWRLSLDHVDPHGRVVLRSAGGQYTMYPRGTDVELPTILAHRDVGNTDCPGNAAYADMDLLRDTAAHFADPIGPPNLVDMLRGGAIFDRWSATGAEAGLLGRPTSPEAAGDGAARYATFERGAVYWSPATGAEPLTGNIYRTWAELGFERGALGLPTSAEIAEPQWIVQNFQHGTLNVDRADGSVTRVIDGIPLPIPLDGAAPVQLERIRPISGA